MRDYDYLNDNMNNFVQLSIGTIISMVVTDYGMQYIAIKGNKSINISDVIGLSLISDIKVKLSNIVSNAIPINQHHEISKLIHQKFLIFS